MRQIAGGQLVGKRPRCESFAIVKETRVRFEAFLSSRNRGGILLLGKGRHTLHLGMLVEHCR